MVGYDTKFKRDREDEGYTLSVFMHWYDNENPPKDRRDALKRLKNILGDPSLEDIIDKFKQYHWEE